MGNPEYRLFSKTHTDRTLYDKLFCSSREILDKDQQDNNYLQSVFLHSAHSRCVCSSLQELCENPPRSLQPDVRCDKIKRSPTGSSLSPTNPDLLFLPVRDTLTHTVHALSVSHTVTDRVLACAGSLGSEADGALPTLPLAPAWPTLPDSSLGSANQREDQAQLRETTGFKAYDNCQTLSSISNDTKGQPVIAATAQLCRIQGFCE